MDANPLFMEILWQDVYKNNGFVDFPKLRWMVRVLRHFEDLRVKNAKASNGLAHGSGSETFCQSAQLK
jgi:hypothetical protein